MTKIELAREIAKRTTARFIETAPRRRPRVGDARAQPAKGRCLPRIEDSKTVSRHFMRNSMMASVSSAVALGGANHESQTASRVGNLRPRAPDNVLESRNEPSNESCGRSKLYERQIWNGRAP